MNRWMIITFISCLVTSTGHVMPMFYALPTIHSEPYSVEKQLKNAILTSNITTFNNLKHNYTINTASHVPVHLEKATDVMKQRAQEYNSIPRADYRIAGIGCLWIAYQLIDWYQSYTMEDEESVNRSKKFEYMVDACTFASICYFLYQNHQRTAAAARYLNAQSIYNTLCDFQKNKTRMQHTGGHTSNIME